MQIGFAKNDITPRVGVELAGFGPYRNRHSIAVRDRLWARAMALDSDGTRAVVISCDIINLPLATTHAVRELVSAETGVSPDAVMVHCTHTHSGPGTRVLTGWGTADPPYLELLPRRIATAAIEATRRMQEATLSHAEVPCEGIGLNRQYDEDGQPLERVLKDDWRPAKPELTDTTCHVIRADGPDGLLGFASYFGCHPVVCCAQTRYIHGDYAGVATNMLERETPGSVGLFLQGAQGDVNTCVVHKPENESLLALDVIAARYANAVRNGLAAAEPFEADPLVVKRHSVRFSRKPWDAAKLQGMLAESEQKIQSYANHADEEREPREMCLEVVYAMAYRRLLAKLEAGEDLSPATDIQGVRMGSLALLASPFETFQAIKNEVAERATTPVPLVMGVTNDTFGYAPDRTTAKAGGYAPDTVPLIIGTLPYANVHDELVEALLALDADLQST